MYAKPLQTLSDLDRNLENAKIDLSLSGKLYFQMKSKVFLQNVLGAAGAGGGSAAVTKNHKNLTRNKHFSQAGARPVSRSE